jgi:outer membrane protein assembly factor BamB/tetratricopeptide (TPR) repeat protein
MSGCCRALIGFAVALALAGSTWAADEELSRIGLGGESLRTTRRVAAADELAAHEKWAEAIDEYNRVLAEAGDELVSLDPRHALQARRICHLRLAALPAAALQIYRNRIDSQAKRLFEQGTASRDPVLLRRLVDETFCSRYTDRALDLLGDLAFESGDFTEAERWWRMLVPPASGRGARSAERRAQDSARALLFPDPQVDVARVRAKQILARLFRGERAGLQEALNAFRALHSTPKGWLAGQEGSYLEILQKLAAQQESLLASARERDWPTFGGNSARSLLVPNPPGRWAHLRSFESPQWKVRLDGENSNLEAENDGKSAAAVVPPFQKARALAFHPIIHGKRVFVTDGRHILGYHLFDGRPILRYDLADYVAEEQRPGLLRLPQRIPAESDRNYTLSIEGNRIYARLGAQGLGSARKDLARAAIHSYLVCLDLQFDVRAKVERWKVVSSGTAAAGPVFEGAPVVGHGRVYVAESRFPGDQIQTAIDCYDADTGKLRWRTEICTTRQDHLPSDGKRRYRQHIVTLAGGTLFYCSHTGAIVAVDAFTGQRLWGVRYSSRVPHLLFGETPPRDVAPCLYAGCRLLVAPLDSDRIFCLDPDTGRTLWERGPLQVLQLLGVAKGRLIFTATTPTPCIRALEEATGNDDWMQPADGSELKTFGRGLLAGDWVFWPIRSDLRQGVYVLDQETGEPLLFNQRINGNLAVGDGCLVVAGVRDLSVYVPEGALLQRRKEEATQPGAPAQAQYRLALAQADAGLFTEALATLDRLKAQASPNELLKSTSLQRLVAERRHTILMDAAEQAGREKQWEQAAHYLRQAVDGRCSLSARLMALSQEAALWIRADHKERAIAVWQSILEDADLRASTILDREGNPHGAASFAADQIEALVRAHGPTVYATIEGRAETLLAGAPGARRKEVLDRLGRIFPNAAVTGPALLELASLNEQQGEFGAAARAYRSFLHRAGDESRRARALIGLARAYERQNCWPAAQAIWQQFADEQGDRTVPGIDPSRSVRAFVTQQLHAPGYQSVAVCHGPELSLPLLRTWPAEAESGGPAAGELFVPVAGSPWRGIGNEYLFTVRDGTITCREGLTGKGCWRATLPETARWIGCRADIIIAAGIDGVYGLSRADGARLWSLSLVTEYHRPHLAAFQFAGSRLFFLQDQCRLFALDVLSGRLLWSAWAPAARFHLPFPSGRFQSNYHAGDKTIVIQTGTGRRLVFDSRTGRRLGRSQGAGQPWPRPPLPLDEHHLCVWTDLEHLTCIDSTTGRESWTYAVEYPTSLSGEPLQALGTQDALMVLVSRNYGYFLECLDSQKGSRRWAKPLNLGTQPTDLEGGTLDDTAVYLVQSNALLAHALADGRLLWKRTLLPLQGRWRTLRTQNCLLVVPREGTAIRWQLHWLFVAAHLQIAFRPAAESKGYLCVLACDPRTGGLLQSLRFPAAPVRANWSFRFQPVPIVAPRLSRRLLPDKESEPAVQVSARGLIVEFEGRAWGLKTSGPVGAGRGSAENRGANLRRTGP